MTGSNKKHRLRRITLTVPVFTKQLRLMHLPRSSKVLHHKIKVTRLWANFLSCCRHYHILASDRQNNLIISHLLDRLRLGSPIWRETNILITDKLENPFRKIIIMTWIVVNVFSHNFKQLFLLFSHIVFQEHHMVQ